MSSAHIELCSERVRILREETKFSGIQGDFAAFLQKKNEQYKFSQEAILSVKYARNPFENCAG